MFLFRWFYDSIHFSHGKIIYEVIMRHNVLFYLFKWFLTHILCKKNVQKKNEDITTYCIVCPLDSYQTHIFHKSTHIHLIHAILIFFSRSIYVSMLQIMIFLWCYIQIKCTKKILYWNKKNYVISCFGSVCINKFCLTVFKFFGLKQKKYGVMKCEIVSIHTKLLASVMHQKWSWYIMSNNLSVWRIFFLWKNMNMLSAYLERVQSTECKKFWIFFLKV